MLYREVEEKIKSHDASLADIVQINLQYYKFLVINNDWSGAIEQALLNNPSGEVLIPRYSSVYNFSRPIVLGDNNSLKIDIGATIKAIADMDIFIKRHGSLQNYTREQNNYNRIYGSGIIDCNVKANIGISLGGYRGYYVDGIKILNPKIVGLVSKGEGVDYAVELIINNIYIENEFTNNNLNTTGMIINSTDNHFSDIITVDMDNGIICSGGGNRFFRCHDWVRNLERTKTGMSSKSFIDLSESNDWDTCYADSKNIGFEFNGGSSFTNCWVYNSPHFIATNVIGFKLLKSPTSFTKLINCNIKNPLGTPIAKAFEGVEFLNKNVEFINCDAVGQIGSLFPKETEGYQTTTDTIDKSKYILFAEIKIPKNTSKKIFGLDFDIVNEYINTDTMKIRNIIKYDGVSYSYNIECHELLNGKLNVVGYDNPSNNSYDIRYYYRDNTINDSRLKIKVCNIFGDIQNANTTGENKEAFSLKYAIGNIVRIHTSAFLTSYPVGDNISLVYSNSKHDVLQARKIIATGNFQSLYYNFDTTRAMTVDSNNIITLNGKRMLQFVDVPIGSQSSGSYGQVAVNSTHLFVYIGVGVGWKRIPLEFW